MELTGKIHSIGQIEYWGDNGFRKRSFVITYSENPDYPQFRQFEFIRDNCEKLSPYKIGDLVKVSFNANGRLWVDNNGVEKCFNTDQAWKIELLDETSNLSPDHSQEEATGSLPDWLK